MTSLTRFSVKPLSALTRQLAAVASGRADPDLVIKDARVLSTYSERMLKDREIWLSGGRIAAVKSSGTYKGSTAKVYDAKGGIVAPGLVDPHIHIESSMVTACAYAEAALLNGTTTIFCDSHEIGNVMDVAGVEAMLEDARQAPLSIFLTVPSTVPATSALLEAAGGDLTAAKIAALFDKWPEAVALGEKMDFVPVTTGDERSHAILAASLQRGRPVSGHVYGREFVAAYAASGITDTHEATDRDIADDLLEAGIWLFLRGGPPTTPWHSLPQAIKTITELGASHKRVAVCTDDRDAHDLMLFGLDWVTREAIKAGMTPEQPGRWARCMAPPGLAWVKRSAAWAAAAAPIWCCSMTATSPSTPGMAANWWSKAARSRRCSMPRCQNATNIRKRPIIRSSCRNTSGWCRNCRPRPWLLIPSRPNCPASRSAT